MKKIVVGILMVLLFVVCITGCTRGHCSVSGCPAESSRWSNYCFEHKCMNSSCNNRGVGSYGYCRECINRAN